MTVEPRLHRKEMERVMSARVKETLNDIMVTHEQIVGCSDEDSEKWLKEQLDKIVSLRRKTKGGGHDARA